MITSQPETALTSSGTPRRPVSRVLLLALGLSVLIGVAFQGSRGLYESTEGRYALCAQETMESGNLLEPMLNGAHHWSKPPLAYLPIVAGIKLFGNNAWGARGFQAVLFVLAVCFLFVAGRELWNEEAGAIAALVYATSPFTAGAASTVSTDNMLVLCQCMAVAFFWLAVRRGRGVFIVAMWAALGLAFLTKGPVGLFPLAGILPAHIMLRRAGTPAPRLLSIPGILAFLVVGLGWYALEIAKHPSLLDTWLMHETIARFATDEYRRNAEPRKIFTMYLPIVLFGTGPWIFYFLFKYKQAGLSRKSLGAWRSWSHQTEWLYLLAAFLIPLFILTVSQSRLPLYLLPLFIPAALAMGKGFSLLVARGHLRARTLVVTACCLAAVFVAFKGAAAYYPSRKNMAQLSDGLRPTLAEHAGKPLVLVSGEPLNGLEFYLNRQIPLHEFPKLGATESGPPDESETLQAGTLVLARAKHLRAAAAFLPKGLFETLYEDSYWSLVELNKPIDLKKQARAAL